MSTVPAISFLTNPGDLGFMLFQTDQGRLELGPQEMSIRFSLDSLGIPEDNELGDLLTIIQ